MFIKALSTSILIALGVAQPKAPVTPQNRVTTQNTRLITEIKTTLDDSYGDTYSTTIVNDNGYSKLFIKQIYHSKISAISIMANQYHAYIDYTTDNAAYRISYSVKTPEKAAQDIANIVKNLK